MDNKIVFLHIAKAGGTTLRRVFKQMYSESEIYEIVSRGKMTRQNIEKFINIPEKDKVNIKLLMGHYSYGIHQYLSPKAKYVSMLRHPVKRVVSGYNYAKSNPNHFLYQKTKSITISDFLQLPEVREDRNRMVQRIAGVEWNELNDDAFAVAKNNIEKNFIALGIMECFNDSLLLFKKVLNWREYPVYIRSNTTSVPKAQIHSEEIDKIEKLYHLDLKLYNWAYQRFKAELDSNKSLFDREREMFSLEQEKFSTSFSAYKYYFEEALRKKYHKFSKLIKN